MFPDTDGNPNDFTDFAEDALEEDEPDINQASVWEEINAMVPLEAAQKWPSKPNTKVPLPKEPRYGYSIYGHLFLVHYALQL